LEFDIFVSETSFVPEIMYIDVPDEISKGTD